ncbi:RNA-directed DNA polymerase, eukaryota, reverse transcriptase zinc-binding domain protein [Tanacetum coccineum]
MNDLEGNKGEVWKKKGVNEVIHDKAKNTNQNNEKKGKNKEETEGSRNVNKFDALNRMEEDIKELEKLKGRMVIGSREENEHIEDVLDNNTGIAKELSIEEMEGMWNIRSMNHLKKQKAALNFIQEEKINVCGIVETHIKPPKLSKVASLAFGGWEWVSNIVHSTNGVSPKIW